MRGVQASRDAERSRTRSVASSLAPEDGEIAFNLAAVLEACGFLEESLEQYKKSKNFGVDRAAMHMRNVSILSLARVSCSRVRTSGQRQDPRQEDEGGRDTAGRQRCR